ncbi:MATE family efflux transporter [Fructobacillus durionis]|uniref:MATE family efflux transporter n=1 Tax=Fructobacillus durionis TaxID=283737 RepID=UPI00360CA464
MDNTLETKPVKKLLISLIIPSLLTVLVSGSYNIVDGIFIGQKLGVAGSSANTYVFMIYALVYSFSTLASQGTASLITLYSGKKEHKNVIITLKRGLLLSVAIAVVQSLLIWFLLPQITHLFGAEDKYFQSIREFSLVFLVGSPFYFVAHTLLYSIRSLGKIKVILIINCIAFLTNTIVGATLILKLNLGFTGSALATIIANIVVCTLAIRNCIPLLSGKWNDIPYVIKIKKLLSIVNMGLPFFLTSSFSVILLSLYNRIGFNYGGVYGLATLSIVSSIYRYIISLMNAITTGIQPVVSYNYGAKKIDRVRESLIYSLKISTVFTTLLFIIIELFSKFVIQMFIPTNEVFINYASMGLRIVMLSLPLQGIINIGTNYFQYINNPKMSTTLVILRQVIFQVPLAILLPKIVNIEGLWTSYAMSDLLICIIIVVLLYKSKNENAK